MHWKPSPGSAVFSQVNTFVRLLCAASVSVPGNTGTGSGQGPNNDSMEETMIQIHLRSLALRLLIMSLFIATALPATAQTTQTDKQIAQTTKTDKQIAAQELLIELQPTEAATQKTVGVLIFPGFEMLDAYGPMEMWGNLKHAPAKLWGGEEKRVSVRLVTIAAKGGEIPSNQGPKTVADFSYDTAPPLDFLVVPGGLGVFALLKDPATLNWLRARAGKAEIVMSVC